MDIKWIERFFAVARLVAKWSKDPSTQVGCVIVGADPRHICVGYNGFPAGVEDSHARLYDREVKHVLTQHAERNALDHATFDLTGATLFTTMYPCSGCAKSIASKKIARVFCPPIGDLHEPWKTDALWSSIVLREAKVDVVEVTA